jgi:SAM-dependent methyltransferase
VADNWSDGDAYEHFLGRWSRQVAPRFLRWLQPTPGLRWLDVGCGTGALTGAILQHAAPTTVLGLDPSEGFLEEAQRRLDGGPVQLRVGAAADAPPAVADVVVSGLALNFAPDADAALAAMAAAAPDGTVAAYVWDYAGRMQLLRTFWDVAVSLDVTAIDLDEAQRFPLCEPSALVGLWERAGLSEVRTASIEVTTEFADFEDLWRPFLHGTGPAPAYLGTLEPPAQERLREGVSRMVHPEPDGRIRMHARAWAVRGHAA